MSTQVNEDERQCYLDDVISENVGWIRIQEKTFKRWMNEHLKHRKLEVEDITEDLNDGLALINLLEVLSHKSIGRHYTKKPRINAQKMENIVATFNFMKGEGIKIVNIDSTDIVQGNMKLILGLIWTLIFNYQIAANLKDDDSGGGPKKQLLNKINQKLRPSGRKAKNFTGDWNDGTLLCCLVNCIAPGLIPNYTILNPDDNVENVKLAMDLAETWLGVPKLLAPEDMASTSADDLSNMTYLSGFLDCKVKEGAPVVYPNRAIARGPGVSGVGLLPGKPAEFEIDASKCGAGEVVVTVDGPDGSEPVKVEYSATGDTPGVYTGAYHPKDEGEYVVNVTFCGVDVPKAPFKVKIYNDGPRNKVDPKKVKVEGPGLTGEDILPSESAWFKINYKEAGPAEPKVEIVGPDSQPVPFKVEQDGVGEQYVTYRPPKFGMYNVAINFGGMPLPNSPYKVKISPKVDASKVKVSGLAQIMRIGDSPVFDIDTTKAGDGKLEAQIVSPSGKMLDFILDDDDAGHHTLKINPNEVGTHTISLMYGKVPVPHGPFSIKVRPECEPEKVNVIIEDTKLRIGVPTKFRIDSTEAGTGDLKCRIIDSLGNEVDMAHDQNAHGLDTFTFVPTKEGDYTLDVTFGGDQVKEEKLTAEPRLKLDKLNIFGDGLNSNKPLKVGEECKMTIDASRAMTGDIVIREKDPNKMSQDEEQADLELLVVGPDGKPVTLEIEESEEGVYKVAFTPDKAGDYLFVAESEGVAAPKCPIPLRARGLKSVKVYGPGIEPSGNLCGFDTHFIVDAQEAGEEKLSVDIEGPGTGEFKPQPTITEPKKGLFHIKYDVPLHNMYDLNVKYGEEPLNQGKPYKPKVHTHSVGAFPSTRRRVEIQVTHMSLEAPSECSVDDYIDVRLKYAQKFKQMASVCGPSQPPTVKVIGPGRKLVDTKTSVKDTVYKVRASPVETGPHKVVVRCSDSDLVYGSFSNMFEITK